MRELGGLLQTPLLVQDGFIPDGELTFLRLTHGLGLHSSLFLVLVHRRAETTTSRQQQQQQWELSADSRRRNPPPKKGSFFFKDCCLGPFFLRQQNNSINLPSLECCCPLWICSPCHVSVSAASAAIVLSWMLL